jgi:Protein of unknown function (DUF4019)
MVFRESILFVALLSTALTAYAQSPTSATPVAPSATLEQQHQDQQMERAALQVAQMVDQNEIAQVWDGASSVTKQIISRDSFVRGVDTDRQIVGLPVARSLALLTYSQSDGRRLPPGLFANVAFATHFANEQQPVRELISFHLDNDHIWRVTGYSLR